MSLLVGIISGTFIVGTVLKDRKEYFDYYRNKKTPSN